MKITNLKWILMLSAVMIALSACNSNAPTTASVATRVATQTPWIIYVPVTTTPEPATVTPLPTVAVQAAAPTRTATRAVTAAPRPSATPTKPAPTPVAVATKAPECKFGTVTLLFPENGALRRTKLQSFSPDTFEFKWTPFQAYEADPSLGYRIDIESRKGNKSVNGDRVYVGHNFFLTNGQRFIYPSDRIKNLASPVGDDVTVLWKVTVIKISGSYKEDGTTPGGTVTECGPASDTWTINLQVAD